MSASVDEPILEALRARRLVIAHRGVCGPGAPENSLAAVRAAVEAGADAVEVDVRRTADGAFVLAHDALAGDPPRAIAAARVADLSLPSLADAVEVVRGRAYLNVDLKVAGCERELADALRALCASGDTLVSTLDRESVRLLKEADPRLAVSLSYPMDRAARVRALLPGTTNVAARAMRASLPLRLPAWLRASRADVLTLWHGVIDARVVRAAGTHGAPVIAWTVNDAATARAMRGAGVRGITTDDPRTVASILRGDGG